MRKIIRIILWISLWLGVLFTVFNPISYIQKLQTSQIKKEKTIRDTKSKLTYVISKENTLSFNIPTFAKNLKFLLTANLSAELNITQNITNIHYKIKYHLLDKDDQTLTSKDYHLKTAYRLFQDNNKTLIKKSFYSDSSLYPCTTKTLFINLNDYPNARKIRLELLEHSDDISDIGIRHYHLEYTPENQQNITWERMSGKVRKHLSRGNIYTHRHLTKREKENIASSLWRPQGPLGIKNKDYHLRRLHVLAQTDHLHSYSQVKPDFYANWNLSATHYLKPGIYDIVFLSLTQTQDSNITLHYYVNSLLKKTQTFILDDNHTNITFQAQDEGIIEIQSPVPISIQVKEHGHKETIDMSPTRSSEYYTLDANKTLAYTFNTPNKRYIRIESRSTHIHDANLTLLLTNTEGNSSSLYKKLVFTPSNHDYIDPFIPQSKPAYLYIEIPNNIKELTLSSDAPIILRLFTRSRTMDYNIYSFMAQNHPEFNRLRNWYTLKPTNSHEDTLIARKVTIYKQVPPPSVNPFIQLGKYQYKQLYPQGRWYAQNLLLKRSLGENYIRPQSWQSIYSKVDPTKKTTIQFQHDAGRNEITPHLLYHNKGTSNEPFSIFLNNVAIAHQSYYGTSGDIALPTVPTNLKHTLHFENKVDYDFYVSHTDETSDIYMKRHFINFDTPLSFNFEKEYPEESLGLQLAAHNDKDENLTLLPLRVEIQLRENNTTQLYTSYTFRNYILNAYSTEQTAIHLTHQNDIISLSKPMYLTLGENLTPGRYTITIYPPKSSSKKYLYLNHIILDKKAKLRISKEIL